MVDGGVIRNLPVEEVREMGADVVISSYVGRNFLPKEDLNNMTGILKQVAFTASIIDSKRQQELSDFRMEPLSGSDYSGFDFNKADSIIAAGYRYSSFLKHDLTRLKDSLNLPDRSIQIKHDTLPDRFVTDSIVISGNKKLTDFQITGQLNIIKGDTYTLKEIEGRIISAHGTGLFRDIT